MTISLPASVVQLRSVSTGDAVGTGFFVTDCFVVTCAHVVNEALGYEQGNELKPTDPLSVFGNDDREHVASVVGWTPMRNEKSGLRNDVALLRVAPHTGHPNPRLELGETVGIVGKEFQTFGFPFDFKTQGRSASGTIGSLAFNHRFQLLHGPGPTFHHVEGGFSGAPVTAGGLVVGMVSAVHSKSDSSGALGYMIPIEEIVDLLTEVDRDAKPHQHSDPTFGNVTWMLQYLEEGRIRRPTTDYEFDLRVRPVDDISEVATIHIQEDPHDYLPGDLKPEDFVTGRPRHPYMVFAPGGAGKSTFLARVIRAAKANGVVPFLLDMAKENVSPKKFDDFFSSFVCNASLEDFQASKRQGKDIILVIDGLNERPASLDGDEVSPINDFFEQNKNIRVIISDRIKRRKIRYPLLEKATILPISNKEVEEAVGDGDLSDAEKGLLSSPFFLDLFLDIREASGKRSVKNTRVGMFQEFFRHRVNISDDELKQLAALAFKAFEMGEGPLLDSKKWEQLANQATPSMADVVARLVTSGVLVERASAKASTLHFRHQLFHDFLNAQALVNMGEEHWRSATFDICTLRAASYEVIELAAEIMEEGSVPLLSEAYDWNYGAVLDCVKNLYARKHGDASKVVTEFQNSIFILNAEKRFDRFEHTAERAQKSYPDFQRTLPFLSKVNSVSDLVSEVRRELPGEGPDFWKQWHSLYTKTTEVEDDELRLLWADPLTAWTAANVFRRFPLSRMHGFALREAFRSLALAGNDGRRSVGARWRIVHLLGVSTHEIDQNFLLDIVLDEKEHRWVRYGAVRALMESLSLLHGSNGSSRRSKFLKRIVKGMDKISGTEVRVEMRRAAFLAKHIPDRELWARDYIQVLEAGHESSQRLSENQEEIAEWKSALDSARKLASSSALNGSDGIGGVA